MRLACVACRDFPNTYTMGKHFTEQMVAEFHRTSIPVAIVRPTLVCGLSGKDNTFAAVKAYWVQHCVDTLLATLAASIAGNASM